LAKFYQLEFVRSNNGNVNARKYAFDRHFKVVPRYVY